jgi:aminopeptidase YwaD
MSKEVIVLNSQELRKRLEKHMDVLCNQIGGRHLGSEGEKKAIEYIAGQFRDSGYEAVKEEFDAPGWKYGEYSLSTVETGKSFPCFPCYYSNSCNAEGKLKMLDSSDTAKPSSLKVKGEICFYTESTEVGAVGGRNALAEKLDKMGASVLIIIGNYQDTENTKIVRTPHLKHLAVLTVSGDTALEIARNIHCNFRIKIDAENFTVKSANVVGRVIGKSGKKIVIGAHYDTAPGIAGAGDNASGTVVVLELARLLKNENNDYSIDFVAFGGEEYGGDWKEHPIGAHNYIKQHKSELKRILWLGNIDGVGNLLGRDVVHIGKSKKIKKITENTVTGILIKDSILGGDDIVFDAKGIPSISFSSKWQSFQVHSPKDDVSKISFDKLTKTCETAFHILKNLLKK